MENVGYVLVDKHDIRHPYLIRLHVYARDILIIADIPL